MLPVAGLVSQYSSVQWATAWPEWRASAATAAPPTGLTAGRAIGIAGKLRQPLAGKGARKPQWPSFRRSFVIAPADPGSRPRLSRKQ